ncbi:autotransporter-associated beta strand repeat-containing protein, partial [Polynucleobacter sp. MWH-Tro8-2-5-gr]
ISGSTVAMTGVAGTAGGAGIYINNNVGITGNATTGTAVSLTGTTKAAGVTGIQTGSSSVIKGYSDVTLTGINTAAPTAAPLNLAGTIIGASGKSINLTGGTTGAGGITTNGAAVKFSNPYSLQNSYSGVIANGTGSGTVENNQGTQTLTGTSTYSGGTNVNTGTLQVGDTSTVGTLGPGNINIASGATLNYFVKAGASTLYTTNNTINGTGTLQKTGTGTLNWGSGAATFAMSGGLIDVQAGTFIGSSSSNEVWTNNKSSLNIASGANFSGVEGVIYVDALTGSGTLMSGNGMATPNIIVGVNGTAAGTTNNVTGVAYNSAGTATFSGVIADQTGASTGPANITKTGSGTQILTGTNTYTGTTTVSGGTLQVGASSTSGTTGTLGTGAVTLSGGSTLSYQRAANTTINNGITGTGNVIANITGTLTDSSAINLTSGSVNLSATGNVLLSANIGASSGVSVTAGSITGTGAGASSTSTLTSAANTSITNTGTGGITLATTGTGNLTTANIVDSGSGNVNIIAGSALSAGNTSGNVLTTNTTSPVTLGSGDKLYVYSGSESATGSLSILNSSFSTLNLANSGLSVNALNNTAYGTSANPNTISGGGTAQAIFRDATAPTYSLTLNNISQVYNGAAGPSGAALISALSNANSGLANLTASVGNNTFAMSAQTAIGNLNVASASVNSGNVLNVTGGTLYTYSGISGYSNASGTVSLSAQPNIAVTPAPLGVAVNATYQGLGTTINGASNITLYGLVGQDLNGTASSVTLNTAGNVTTGGSNTVTNIVPTSGWLFSNYVLNAAATSATATAGSTGGSNTNTGGTNSVVITAATLTYNANTASSAYGAGPVTNGGNISGYVGNDNLNGATRAAATTGTAVWTSGVTATSDVANNAYSITGSGLSAVNNNYVFTQATGNSAAASVTPAVLDIAATGTYNGSTTLVPVATSIVGKNGQTISFTSLNIDNQNVSANGANYVKSFNGLAVTGGTGNALLSNYTINGMTSLASNTGGAYSASGPTNTVNLSKAALGISNTTATYAGSTTIATGNGSFTLTGLVGSDV